MRVGVQTWGTEGDIRPFLALGKALVGRGHTVRMVYTSIEARDFGPLAAACGVQATSVGADYFESHREHLAQRARTAFLDPSPIRQVRSILEDLMDPVAARMVEAGQALARGSDVFISHFLAYPGHVAAERERVPHVMVGLVPMFASSHCAPIGMPSLGRVFHRVEWWVANRVFESIFAPRMNPLRQRVGLPLLKSVLDPNLVRSRLALVAVSPSLFPTPPDWNARASVVGAMMLPEDTQPWKPDAALRQFLDAGPAPAFLSFGSMFNLDLERTATVVRLLADAVERAGLRGIIQAPEPVVRGAQARKCIHHLVRAPHVHLFPRCSVVVHHGGAGTTQSALLAGRPSVVVPHAADQFFWGGLVHTRGAGCKPLLATRLTVDSLAARLRQTAKRPEFAVNAQALGRALARENGAERAATLIEAAVKAHG